MSRHSKSVNMRFACTVLSTSKNYTMNMSTVRVILVKRVKKVK
jgi:hypothetical protein